MDFPLLVLTVYPTHNIYIVIMYFVKMKNANDNPAEVEIAKNLADMQIMEGGMVNGESVEGSPGPASQHIALHLLSKVLDDETIFNLEEGNNPPAEAFVPLTVDPTMRCVSKILLIA